MSNNNVFKKTFLEKPVIFPFIQIPSRNCV